VMRLLVASEVPMTGVAIAAAVGVTQPRASQILKQLTGLDAVLATADGYIGEPATLLDLYRIRTRPHLVEPEAYWYSTRPLTEQASRLCDLARTSGTEIAFSADLAPDLIVPWRHPTVTIAYIDGPLALADAGFVPAEGRADDAVDGGDGEARPDAGFVPAEGRADASLVLRWTDDQGLLSPAPPWVDEVDDVPITDPCQQWWDLFDLGGQARAEAADRLRSTIVARSLPRSR